MYWYVTWQEHTYRVCHLHMGVFVYSDRYKVASGLKKKKVGISIALKVAQFCIMPLACMSSVFVMNFIQDDNLHVFQLAFEM